MALADFFTLSEIKDGLSSPDRVETLINVMRIENDKEVNNVVEASSQWSTVAKTIVCTENKECLDCFVLLGGLCFVNTWLNNIQKNASELPDGVLEESLAVLLQALEKLPVNNEKVTSSGLGITLKSFTVYSSSVINERARTLLDSWELLIDSGDVDANVKEEDMSVNGCTNVSTKINKISSMEASHMDGNNEIKSTCSDPNTATPDPLPAEKVQDVLNNKSSVEVGSAETLDHETAEDGKPVAPHSTDLCTVKENISITGSISADVDTGFTNTKNESYSSSKSEEERGSLKQKVEVLADVGSGENGVTAYSTEHSREDKDKQSSNSCFPETEGNSLRSDDDKDETKAAKKDPVSTVQEVMEVDIPQTVCSCSSQDKILDDDPAEQVPKSFRQTASSGKEFSTDSITVKAEDEMDVTEPSHANAVVQEAEIETRPVLGFDLNEEVSSEDLDSAAVPNQELNYDEFDHEVINQTVATSVISACRPVASSRLPAGRLQFEGTLGWKGSAATSAFRPASPRKPLESDNITSSRNSLDLRQNVNDFDLNMVDDPNADNTPDSVIAVSSSHPSEESCVEIGPNKSKRAELDLNSLGDIPHSACLSMNGLPFSQQNAYISSSPGSSSSSVHPSMWDLDLNKKFSLPNPGNSTINFLDSHGIRKPTASEISFLGARDEPFLQSQLHPNGNISGFTNFLPPSIHPNPSQQPLQSFMYRPGFPVTMFDPRGGYSMSTHIINPAQPPYLMNMMAAPPPPPPPQGVALAPPFYSSFDPNMLYMNDAPNQSEPHARQYLMSTQGGFVEQHSTPVSQPSLFLTKRKVPHSGWDPYHHGFNHHEPPGKS